MNSILPICAVHLDLDWEEYIEYDKRYERPAEVDFLIGDPAKAKRQLGWEPKVKFKDLVRIMVESDLELAVHEAKIKEALKITDLKGSHISF